MALRDPVKFYAVRLHEATSGMGTNDTRLIRIIVSRLEVGGTGRQTEGQRPPRLQQYNSHGIY